MNEQQLADLFSEQVDRLLQGEAPGFPTEAGEIPELLNLIGQPISNIQFQPSPTAQAAFRSQLAGWFGAANGGSAMTILGLSKVWFITILISIVTVIVGTGIIAVVVTSVFVVTAARPVSVSPTVPAAGTGTVAATAVASTTATVTATVVATTTPVVTATAVATTTPIVTVTVVTTPTVTATTTITPQPTVTSTVFVSGTPVYPPMGQIPSLIFITNLHLVSLCQGSYLTQRTLVNYSQTTLTNAALGWEVIEGPDLVDQVTLVSPEIEVNNNNGSATGAVSNTQVNYESLFNPIPAGQKVKVDIKVKVKDNWWKQENGTQIKVKVSIKSKGGIPGPSNPHQIITIVKQGSQWVTLKGIAHFQGNQGLLIDGHIINFNNCTGFPPTLPAGAQVEVIGILQPDGTFVAINITIINITVIVGDFDSGVPTGGDSDNDGGSNGGGGGSKGGNKGGSKGGGKGGSKGGS
jgi:uncharacterized membrane protein YgcG